MELEGYHLVGRAIHWPSSCGVRSNTHPVISKYFKTLTPAEMIPAEYRQSGYADFAAGSWLKAVRHLRATSSSSIPPDHPALRPRRLRRTEFKGILASDYDIQINKDFAQQRARPSQHQQTRSDLAHIIKALADWRAH
jgi:arginine decarboxylase